MIKSMSRKTMAMPNSKLSYASKIVYSMHWSSLTQYASSEKSMTRIELSRIYNLLIVQF